MNDKNIPSEQCYYKTIRLYKKYSKKKISDYLGFSPQYLATLENEFDNENLSNKIKKKLNKIYDVTPSNELEPSLLCLDAIDDIIGNNLDEALNKIRIVDGGNVINNKCFPIRLILSACIKISYKIDDIYNLDDSIYIIERIRCQMPERLKLFSNLVIGNYHLMNKEISKAKEYFDVASNCNQLDISGMAYYFLARVELASFKPTRALRYNDLALYGFEKCHLFSKIVDCELNRVNAYIQLRDFDLAYEIAFDSEKYTKQVDSGNKLDIVMWNEMIALFGMKKYKEIVGRIKKFDSNYIKQTKLYFYICAYSYYEIGDKTKALYYIEESEKLY